MKKLLAAIATALLLFAPFAGADEEPLPQQVETVGLLVGSMGACSAIVVRYDTIVTAEHCTLAAEWFIYKNRTFRVVDGKTDLATGTDSLYLHVDGYIEAPYAEVYRGEIPVGSEVMAIGFAGGEVLTVSYGEVLGTAVLEQEIVKLFNEYGLIPEGAIIYEGQACGFDPFCIGPSLTHSAHLIPGMSGGPTYAKINGEWKLVAVNSWRLGDPFLGVPIEYGSAPLTHLYWH